ncbi:MAG: hypothetical protein ACLP7J_03045 [Streptosporangiaceae bacterium]
MPNRPAAALGLREGDRIIMVGQDVQSQASDARAAKTYEDTERIGELLNTQTAGGITEVLEAIDRLAAQMRSGQGS